MTLRAVVIGAGFAGEGHTTALRAAGVEVVAMCGRTPEPAKAMAEKLGITDVRFDWRDALETLRPDIVAIATPAAPHQEMVEVAAQVGSHILCDKPMALDAAGARAMLQAVEQAGVKHAYAANSRYGPIFAHTKTLLANSLIGQVREIECIYHMSFPELLPFHWFHQLSQGGGLLNNGLTHSLGQVCHMTGGKVISAAGEARRLIDRAPVGPTIHDWRDLMDAAIDPAQAAQGEWREVDADFGATVIVRLQMPEGNEASALFQISGRSVSPQPNYIALYGTQGTLHLACIDSFWPNVIQHYKPEDDVWEELSIPPEIIAALPQIEDGATRDWHQLCREFVADIRGEGDAGYPTFRDGVMDAEVIEIVRNEQGWVMLPNS